jgi:hypothetical protein
MVFLTNIVSMIKDKAFFIFVELWLLLAYSESAPRLFDYLWGLYRVNISNM